MFDRVAPDLRRIFSQAGDIAHGAQAPANTVHLLLAMFVTPCPAREALAEVGVDEGRVIRAYKKLKGRPEHPGALELVRASAVALSGASQAEHVDSMVLLASLLKVRKALASQVLRQAEVNVTELRARVIGHVTLGVDRASSTRIRAVTASSPAVRAVAPPGPPQVPPASSRRRATARSTGPTAPPAAAQEPTAPAPPTPAEPQRPSAPPTVLRRVVQQGTRQSLETPTRAQAAAAPPPPSAPPLGPYDLDPQRFPTLSELGRNLTKLAAEGEIAPLIGRDEIVDQVIEVLSMKKANNPCLVGAAGVGKTAIVEGMAARIAGDTQRYGRLGQAIIVELHISSILAGTSYRGAFAERMKALRAEVAAANGEVIVFLDEVHTMMGAGAGDGALDAANDLKTALARGRFPLIGATTRDEYVKFIEKDAALDRRFQVIDVPEPNREEALRILSGVAPIYVQHHGLPYSHEAIASAVHLSHRFITDRQLPDKAISVLDRAGSQARRRGKRVVETDDVARAVQKVTKVPMARLLADERSRIRDLAADIQQHIVGQDEAIARITRRIRRNYAGFSEDRPLASFVFAGPPGVGKTAAASALADALFLVDDALVVLDMSEFTDAASASRLIGSPPGYVGHQQRGMLSEAMHKRPYRVLLFEHIDRAAPEIVGLVGQVLATGRITDNHGRRLDMRNAVVVMTTNAGADAILTGSTKRVVGFSAPPRPVVVDSFDEDRVVQHVKGQLGAEICGGVDDVVLFRPLSDEAGAAVVRMAVDACLQQLYDNRLIQVRADDSVVQHVADQGGFDPATGARGLRSRVSDVVVDFLTEAILDGALRPGSQAVLQVRSGRLVVLAEDPAKTPKDRPDRRYPTAPTNVDPHGRP